MPIFDYQCEKCEKVVEKIVTFADADKDFPCDCKKGAKLKKVTKANKFNFALKGRWFKTTGGY